MTSVLAAWALLILKVALVVFVLGVLVMWAFWVCVSFWSSDKAPARDRHK